MEGVFSVDVEQDLHTGEYEGITRGLVKLIRILNRFKIKSTLFVTGRVLERYPGIFRRIEKQGHEIALHGYSHKRYDSMNLRRKKKI